MTILLSDPRVANVPVHESDEPLTALPPSMGPAAALVRLGLANRLLTAQNHLPTGLRLKVVEGHRTVQEQRAIIATYRSELLTHHPDLTEDQLRHLSSRFVAPIGVAPHVAGAAVDLTLTDASGLELDLGTPIDATPEQSGGRCFTAATDLSPEARCHRELLRHVLGQAGLVNYPTEWWHWSFGDRYWALVTGAPGALYGPVEGDVVHAESAA